MELVRGKKREFLRFYGTADIIEADVFILFIWLFQNAEYAFLSRLLSGKGEDWVMGQKDISLVRYFEDRERYADLINGFVFQGNQVVSEDDVQEMDSRVTGEESFLVWDLSS